jgi:hypothetical protein
LASTIVEVERVLGVAGVFIGSVPADEELLESMVVCPECGKCFHRWGHLQSFSRRRLQTILSETFNEVEVRRVNFCDSKELNWKGKTQCLVKGLQARLDKKASNQNFFFRARKG